MLSLRGSLRARLIRFLLPPLALIMAISAAMQYYVSLRPAGRAFDQALADTAIALAQELSTEGGRTKFVLSEETERLLRTAQDDEIYYEVRGPSGVLIAGDAGLTSAAAMPGSDEARFYDSNFRGRVVRVAAISVACGEARCSIEVAETTNKRDALTRDILLGTLVPEAVLALVAFAAIWFGVGRALEPLTHISREISNRSPRDLSPMNVTGVPIEVRPLTEALNSLLAKLNESGLAQQRFLSTAAHQIRTPLASLKAQTELALMEAHPAELHEKLEQINEATARASRLATQLLALARSESDAHLADPVVTLDLRELVQGQIDDWVRMADAKDIDLGFELEFAQVQVRAILMEELMRNLVHNALEYAPKQTQVTVRCGTQGQHSFFAVQDRGPGIAPEFRDRVFERFFRLPQTPGTGSGLGLAIVREIASAHGARVEFVDSPDSVGTHVRVVLPSAYQRE